jgi:hypothetical protein
MGPVVVLGVVLVGALLFAVRIGVSGLRGITLDASVLRPLGSRFGEAMGGALPPTLEALREACRASPGRARDAWLAEAEGELQHALRVPSAELRACAKLVNAASFCVAAWTIRIGLVDADAEGFAFDGALGQALACIVLGFVATGAIAAVHRTLQAALRDEREAFADLSATFE